MAFKLKSGNTSSFKEMGSSPAKHRLTRRVPNKVDFDRLPKSYPKDHAVEIKHEHPKDEKKGDSIKVEDGGVVISDGVKEKSPVKQTKFPNSPGAKKIKKKKFIKKISRSLKGIAKELKIPQLEKGKKSPAKQRVSDLPKNFNIKGSKGSTTPGYSTTKAAKTQNFRNAANKIKTVSSKTNVGNKVVNIKPTITATEFDKTTKALDKRNKASNALKEIAKKNKKKAAKKVIKKTATKVASRFAGLAGLALTAYDIAKFTRDATKKHGNIEKAWDKNKWWGDESGNLLKADDPKKGSIKAIDLIRKAKIKKK